MQNAIFGNMHREAAPEVVQGHLLPVHFANIPIAHAYALLRLLRRGWIRNYFDASMIEPEPQQHTVMDDLRQALRQTGLGMRGTVIYANNCTTELDLFSPVDQRKWLHQLRELCRDLLIDRVACRRPREFHHCKEGVARDATIKLWPKLREPKLVSALKRWLSGSIPFKGRIWRHHRAAGAPSPFCVWCHHHEQAQDPETIELIIFECPYSRHRGIAPLPSFLLHGSTPACYHVFIRYPHKKKPAGHTSNA